MCFKKLSSRFSHPFVVLFFSHFNLPHFTWNINPSIFITWFVSIVKFARCLFQSLCLTIQITLACKHALIFSFFSLFGFVSLCGSWKLSKIGLKHMWRYRTHISIAADEHWFLKSHKIEIKKGNEWSGGLWGDRKLLR